MFYWIYSAFTDKVSFFNVFKYITMRSGMAFIISFLIMIIFGKRFIAWLKGSDLKEHVQMYGQEQLEKMFSSKQGTPTMGGLLIGTSLLTTILLCGRLDTTFIWLSIFVSVWFMVAGLFDDLVKIKNKKGLSRSKKMSLQIGGSVIFSWFLYADKAFDSTIYVPFFKNVAIALGVFYVLWAALVVVSSCNAVNFTDGMDGLAIGASVMVAIAFAIMSYIGGNKILTDYLFLPYVKGAGELTVVCSAIIGSGLGYLWFNAHPAEVFMGDTGSSMLGALIGAIAVMIHKEFLLMVAGGLFVLEGLSVLIQIVSIRVFKKRIFLAAPFHLHMRKLGMSESKAIIRLWIVSMVFVILSLMTLKIR